jgi:peptidoglycan/xylan/chitin deacetylase (PgdA/CDA1 family)
MAVTLGAVTFGAVMAPAGTASAAQAAGAVPAATAAHRVAGTDQVAVARKKKKTVKLTFDDGPGDYTYQVLDVLKKYKVKATFCVVGKDLANYPKTTLRIVREGHLICNHSFTHADLTKLSTAKAKKEITDCQAAIKKATKVNAKVMRFPYGASNPKVRKIVKDLKLRSLGWDVDPEDWRNPPAKTITARILKATGPGDIVLLHDGGGVRKQTVASLAGTITKLRKKGYTFVVA